MRKPDVFTGLIILIISLVKAAKKKFSLNKQQYSELKKPERSGMVRMG